MSIGGNGSNGGPPRPPSPPSPAELRLQYERTRRGQAEITIEEDDRRVTIESPPSPPSLRQRLFTGVRNTLSSPVTVLSVIVCAIATNHVLSLLSGLGGGTSSSGPSSALSSGTSPVLGCSPRPPALNPTQVNGAAPQMPASGSPVPPLTQILRNAHYSTEEQQELQRNFVREGARPRQRTRTRGRGHNHSHCQENRAQRRRAERAAAAQAAQQAAPPAAQAASSSLPVCPPRIVFTTPTIQESLGQYRASDTRRLLRNGDTSNICAGPTPRIAFQSPNVATPRFQCRNSQTGRATTGCNSTDRNLQCASGEESAQCTGLRLKSWGDAVGSACRLARDLKYPLAVVLEGTNLPQDRGMAGNAGEQALFDAEISQFCHENVNIYSEESPFEGASAWARERIQFNANPQDILQGRGRETAAEPPVQEAEPEAAADQEETQNSPEDGAQGAGSSPPQDTSDKQRKPEQ